MAIIYVRSTDGSDADNGSTWALAKATLVAANTLAVAGDTIYVSQNHAESVASFSPTWKGTRAAPTKIVCANDAAQPPTAVATTGTATLVAADSMQLSPSHGSAAGGGLYWYGLTFSAGTGVTGIGAGTGNSSGTNTGTYIVFDNCSFVLSSTASSTAQVTLWGVEVIKCSFKFGNASQRVAVTGFTHIIGGSVLAGGTSPTALFQGTDFGTPGRFVVEGFDLSNCSAGINLYENQNDQANVNAVFRYCKLPPSWSGSPIANASSLHINASVEMINCSSSGVNYAYWRQTYAGSVRHETTVVRTGGAAISWKIASNANCAYPAILLSSEPILANNSAVGSPLTASVEILTNNVTLKDDDIYLELMYLSSSGAPIYTRITDSKTDVLGTGTAQDASSVTWTTTGIGTPIKQKISVTFTPQMAGVVMARVYVCKPSVTVYVDPKLTIA